MTEPNKALPRRRWGRTELALLLTSPALIVVVIAVSVALAFWPNQDVGPEGSAQAGIARVGDDLALVIVTDNAGEATTATSDSLAYWSLFALALALIPAAGAAWVVAGRVLSIVDGAHSDVEAADDVRRTRLQEVVHELRTPLAVMGTNLELAAEEAEHAPDATGYIEAARRAVGRMGRTVDDLEGHGRLAVEKDGPVDLASLVEAVVAEHSGPGRSRGVHVVLSGSSSPMVPTADPAAVGTAIGNFLGNALRLAPRGSTVNVAWGEAAGWAWISVSDEGPGLARHLHARAFVRGWQGPHDRDRGNGKGEAGLGLTIARQLTEAQGGVVTLESEEGGGATLTVWLPLDHDADQNAIVAPDRVHPVIQPWHKDFLPT